MEKKVYKVYTSETTVHSRVLEINAISAEKAVQAVEEMLDLGMIEFRDQDLDMACGGRETYIIEE